MSIIDELWYEYLSTNASALTDKEREVMPRLAEADEKLREGLTESQIKLLDLCNDYLDEITSASVKQAFTYGVNFTAEFLFEALRK